MTVTRGRDSDLCGPVTDRDSDTCPTRAPKLWLSCWQGGAWQSGSGATSTQEMPIRVTEQYNGTVRNHCQLCSGAVYSAAGLRVRGQIQPQ